MQVGRRERDELREQIRAEVRGSDVYCAINDCMATEIEWLSCRYFIESEQFVTEGRHNVYRELLNSCDKMFEYALHGSIVL